MRQVITISLPKQMVRAVKEEIKSGKFSSTSEFFRHLLREWEEANLLAELRASQKEFAEGKGILLRHVSDLDR